MKLRLVGNKVFVEISPEYLLFVAEMGDLVGKTLPQIYELARIVIKEATDEVPKRMH